MSPYRRSADISGTSQTGQLRKLDTPTLDQSTDTYIWFKAVRDLSELILQGAATGSNRAYTNQLATMAHQLYGHPRSLNNRSWTNAQAHGQVSSRQDDQVAAVVQIINLLAKEPAMSLVSRLVKTLNDAIECKRGTAERLSTFVSRF
jgi:hypothetical protein